MCSAGIPLLHSTLPSFVELNQLTPSYGFQTTTKLRLVLSVALVDAAIKDSDIVSVFRALHNLLLRVISNPFLSLPRSFHATPAKAVRHTEESLAGLPPKESAGSAPADSAPSPDSPAKDDAKEVKNGKVMSPPS